MPQPALFKTNTVIGVPMVLLAEVLFVVSGDSSCTLGPGTSCSAKCFFFCLSDRLLVWLHDVHISSEASNKGYACGLYFVIT